MLQIFNRWHCMLYDLNIKFGYFWDILCMCCHRHILEPCIAQFFGALNMSNHIPTKHYLREVLILFFNSKKSTTESHRLLSETYGDYTSWIRTCEYWFRCFTSNDYDPEDKNVQAMQKKLKMRNWRRYSIKISVKRKMNWQNYQEVIVKPLLDAYMH